MIAITFLIPIAVGLALVFLVLFLGAGDIVEVGGDLLAILADTDAAPIRRVK